MLALKLNKHQSLTDETYDTKRSQVVPMSKRYNPAEDSFEESS